MARRNLTAANGATYTYDGRKELETLARDYFKTRGSTGWIATASLDIIKQALETGHVPQLSFGDSEPAKAPAAAPSKTAAALQALIDEIAASAIDEDAVRRIVDDQLRSIPPVRFQINDGPVKVVKGAHPRFERLVKHLSRSCPRHPAMLWVHGPQGTGKTHAAAAAGKALDWQVFIQTPCRHKHEILGYKDLQDRVSGTAAIDWAKHEGHALFVLDEGDGWGPDATLGANFLLGNQRLQTPDGAIIDATQGGKYIKAAICTANTTGNGATHDFSSRAKMDAAFRDRFPIDIYWPPDEDLELRLCLAVADPWLQSEGDDTALREKLRGFVRHIQKSRQHFEGKGIRNAVTARKLMAAARSHAAGDDQETAWKECIVGALSQDQQKSALDHLRKDA